MACLKLISTAFLGDLQMGCRRGEVLGPNIECITQITQGLGKCKGDDDKHADCLEILTRGCIKV